LQTERIPSDAQAAAVHVLSTASFPTGATLSPGRRADLLRWAAVNHALIVEDSYGAGFYYESNPPKPIYAQAGQSNDCDRVIYLGSLSQMLLASLRIGFIVASPTLIDRLVQQCEISGCSAAPAVQHLVAEIFRRGMFEEHTTKLLQLAQIRRKALLAGLAEWADGLISFKPVMAGFQQSIWLADGLDDLLIFERGLKEEVGVIPLSPYFFADEPRAGLGLNFLRLDERKISQGLAVLRRVVESSTVPSR